MKRANKLLPVIVTFLCILVVISCTDNKGSEAKKSISKDENAISSVLVSADSLLTFPFVKERVDEIKNAFQQPRPVLLCKDSLGADQSLAQLIALNDPVFTQYLTDTFSKQPYRNEVFGVYSARQSDMNAVKTVYNLASSYRVEMYNYALNSTSIALVDIQQQKVLQSYHLGNAQPDISAYLRNLAVKIAIESPEVQQALGIKPEEKAALMASTKTSLNRTRCERSRHLCVAPTFIKEDKALWAIVDLTDHRLVGIRWTNVGNSGPAAPMLTEKRLQDDKITSCYCEIEQKLNRNGWNMNYMLTSSDGLRISNVAFNNKPVLKSAKLVDWHVSYSGTDGFGYSDAVGCPYFSQAAVVAWEIPKIAELKDEKNNSIGFVLEQTYRSEGWPTPCNYNYRQRYEFYNDGRFRVACASIGRGCGNMGTYRPVFRIAFSGEQNNFYQCTNSGMPAGQADWQQWQKEKWNEQNSLTAYSAEGYLYKISSGQGGYYMEPGRGQFKDGGRGDFSFVYVTKNIAGREEGENDLPTIGPCCNNDYHQGPEKFIEPQPDDISNSPLVVWYVAQMKNDDRKGNEYCWAENVLVNGVWSTKVYPCFAGPMFVPVK
jgi:hypothetical protein